MLGNLGFLAGTFVTRRLGARIGIGPVICLASPIGAAGMLIMALAPSAGPIPVLVAGQVILGMGIALFNLQSLSLRQAITTPSRSRSGRCPPAHPQRVQLDTRCRLSKSNFHWY
jgi:MFS family permease